MDLPTDLDALSRGQLRALAAQLIVQVTEQDREAGEKCSIGKRVLTR